MARKKRLDEAVVESRLAEDLNKARALIMAGQVLVDGVVLDKAGSQIKSDTEIALKTESCPYVGRGGFKLKAAIDHFRIDLEGLVCADVGSSTGGFTHVMLKEGAGRVFAIDVAKGELDWSLRNREEVDVLEGTNACFLEELPEKPEFVSVDVSLISVRRVLPQILKWSDAVPQIVILFKPQYEASRDELPPGAVIKDKALHTKLLDSFCEWVDQLGLKVEAPLPSPIKGKGGNQEFLLYLCPGAP